MPDLRCGIMLASCIEGKQSNLIKTIIGELDFYRMKMETNCRSKYNCKLFNKKRN